MYSRIKDLREDNDWSQKTVAAHLGCSQQSYSLYEKGERDIPTDMLIKLAKLYNTSTDYLLGIANKP